MKRYLVRIIILVIIVAAVFAVIKFTPAGKYFNIREIFKNRDALINQVQNRFLLSSVIYIVFYIVVVALSIPGASILTILGGFFFGPFVATGYINVGATLGAFIIFIAARFFIGEMVQNKYGEKLKKFNEEIEKNGSNYLITLRLIPIFPFWLINLFAGVTKIKPITFLWTTSLGIIPGSFAYAYSGYAVAKLGAEPGVPKNLIFAFLLLAILSIVPVVYKKMKARRAAETQAQAQKETEVNQNQS
jgi:uncharacterized membrane protein YdjX (TVP38/TMEM64 family)